jgi:protein phosphatase
MTSSYNKREDEIIIRQSGINGFSIRGRRNYNEDFIAVEVFSENPLRMAVVLCDGVGGSEKGEVASRFIAQETIELFRNTEYELVHDKLVMGIADKLVEKLDEFAKTEDITGAATTWCLLYLQGNKALMAHLGDSRIYAYRRDGLIYQSRDHSIVSDMIDRGAITEEEATNHPMKNVISRAFEAGKGRSDKADKKMIDLQGDEFFVLCSDGFNPVFPKMKGQTPYQWDDFESIIEHCSKDEDINDNVSLLLIEPSQVTDNSRKSLDQKKVEEKASQSLKAVLPEIPPVEYHTAEAKVGFLSGYRLWAVVLVILALFWYFDVWGVAEWVKGKLK